MKTSTPTFQLSGWFGEDVAIEMIAKAGFDAFDYSLHEIISFDWKNLKSTVNTKHPYFQNDYNKHLKMLKRVAEDNGIVCNQSHAPFPLFDKAVEGELKKCIEATAELGGEIIIIHPDKSLKLEENIEVYSELLPFAKSHGVKIACENMFDWRADLGYAVPKACGTKEDFVAHLNALNDPYFVACLDIGHAEMMKDGTCAVDMIKALGPKLKALHIHDNDRTHDNHQMPFTMDIKYKPIMKALKEVGYDGYFTLEADNYTRMIGREKAQQGQIDLKKSLDKLIKLYNNA